MTRLNEKFAEIPYQNGVIQNNTWGFNGNGDPPQSISGPPGDPAGWTWDWPGADNTKVVAYPEIIFGKKPWSPQSTSPQLPKMIGALGSIAVDYSLSISATGAYNAAFDIWITSSPQADEASIRTEVMVWVCRRGLNPAGGSSQLFDTPYGQMRIYEATMDAWKYVACVLENELLAATMDLKFFIDFLVDAGRITSGQYLASVEFGNEIAFGQGETVVNNYSINVT
ncbi:GH12 family glycosyl hydrolase domain-containing protein [Zavarzinella formosa]|uniref:GH12 family glycosyl hydrolase domain-containing protein n=1 Tax=Zavarzinella formosa TaxID=360055 RepID=UPI0002DE940E|nr:hypothetical protein [Zavarzinella formosa]